MPALAFPMQALQVEVEALLLAAAVAVNATAAPHIFGARGVEQLGAPPRYVWIPSRTREQKDTSQRDVDQPQQLYALAEYVEIHCWGTSFAQAAAMRNNMLHALKQAVTFVRFENAEWARPGKAWNQSGELWILEVSVTVPVFAQYTDLATLEYPEENTVVVESADGDLQFTDDLDTAGATSVTTTTTDGP